MNDLILCLSVVVFVGSMDPCHAQKVAVIAGDLRGADAEWKALHEKAGGHSVPAIPRSEIRIYDLARPDAPPKNLTVGAFACGAFYREGVEIVVASRDVKENSTRVQFFATDSGKELRSFAIPDFQIIGYSTTGYAPFPSIRLAKIMGASQFILLGRDLRDSAARIEKDGKFYSGEIPCAIAVVDTERLLGTTTLPSTSSLFATFPASSVPMEGALIVSLLNRIKVGFVQQISFCAPNEPRRPGVLLAEIPNSGYVLTSSQNLIYGWGTHLRLLELPRLVSRLAETSISPKVLKSAEGVADSYSALKLLPRGNGDLLAFNTLTKEGGVSTGKAQMLVIRLKDGEVQPGPKISDHFFDAGISSDGKKLVMISSDPPQLVVLSLPDLQVVTSIDAVMPNPSQVVVE